MHYYMTAKNGYIQLVGVRDAEGEGEITEAEYNAIMEMMATKPQVTETIGYALKEDLTWEAYEIERVEAEPTAEDILSILTGETE